jgi:hypothetical protein
MTMTTKRARKPTPTPLTDNPDALCSVDIADGRAVYWDGEQRGGTIDQVPKHIAIDWLLKRYATMVYEPK